MSEPTPDKPHWTTPPRRRSTASTLARALLVVAAALLPLSVAWALSTSGSDSEEGAAPSPTVSYPDPGLAAALAPDPPVVGSPRSAPTLQDKLTALRHPLVGLSRGRLVQAVGRPSRRTTEGGATMELLEYAVGDEEYQVVVIDKRVVEVLRFR